MCHALTLDQCETKIILKNKRGETKNKANENKTNSKDTAKERAQRRKLLRNSGFSANPKPLKKQIEIHNSSQKIPKPGLKQSRPPFFQEFDKLR